MLLQLNQAIENNQLHIVVTLLDNQINVTLGSSLVDVKEYIRDCTKPKASLLGHMYMTISVVYKQYMISP